MLQNVARGTYCFFCSFLLNSIGENFGHILFLTIKQEDWFFTRATGLSSLLFDISHLMHANGLLHLDLLLEALLVGQFGLQPAQFTSLLGPFMGLTGFLLPSLKRVTKGHSKN